MTAPRLPTVSLGNLASDLSTASAGFIQGLKAEEERRRKAALDEALLRIRTMQATEPERPFHIVTQTPEGPKHEFVDPRSLQTLDASRQAQEPQFFTVTEDRATGQLGLVATPRSARPQAPSPVDALGKVPEAPVPQAPAPQATPVTLPPGQQPRDISPAVIPIETAEGPQIARVPRRTGGATLVPGVGGGGVTPKADDASIRRARDAFEMIQANRELEVAVAQNPNAYNEAAGFVAARNFFNEVPIIGPAIDQIIATASNTLSPEGAAYVRAWTQAGSARAFARGGATLTANEIKWATDALGPRPGDPPEIKAQRQRLLNTVIFGLVTGNPAWQRYRPFAQQLGFDEEDVAGGIVPPAAPALPQMNPRFAPRRP